MKERNKIIAYDFFDTLVHRKIHPEVILYNWAKQCSRFLKFRVSGEELYRIRKEQEKNKDEVEELAYEHLLSKIVNKIHQEHEVDISIEEFVDFSYKTEIDIESENIYIDYSRINEIKEFYNQGKKIIIISDFYMGYEFFESILNKLDIRKYFCDIFVSSECGKRKSTGNLYKYVCNKCGCSLNELTMCGDNFISDFKVPKSLGIKAKYIKYKDRNKIYDENYLKRQYKILTHRNPKNNPINGYAAELLYFYSELYKVLIQEEFEEVLFCSREGQYMKELFDIYQEICFGDNKIQSKYFYVSRKAVFTPALLEIENEKFDMIFRQYYYLTVNEFFKNIGFDEKFIKSFCEQNNIDRMAIISGDVNDDIKTKILNNQAFKKQYDYIRRNQRELFIKYLNQEGFNLNKIALVDVGWKGTIQDCIKKILPMCEKLKGYYIGLRTDKFGCENPKEKCGILFSDYPNRTLNFDLLEHESMFYERIFVANHGPVLGYEMKNNAEVVPIIQNKNDEVKIYEYMENYQKDFKDLFIKILYKYKRTLFLPSDLYELMVRNALWRVSIDFPKIWNIKEGAKNLVPENFGAFNSVNKENSWEEVLQHLKKNPYRMTDFVFRLIDKSHLTFLSPIGTLFCKLNYFMRSFKIEKQKE